MLGQQKKMRQKNDTTQGKKKDMKTKTQLLSSLSIYFSIIL